VPQHKAGNDWHKAGQDCADQLYCAVAVIQPQRNSSTLPNHLLKLAVHLGVTLSSIVAWCAYAATPLRQYVSSSCSPSSTWCSLHSTSQGSSCSRDKSSYTSVVLSLGPVCALATGATATYHQLLSASQPCQNSVAQCMLADRRRQQNAHLLAECTTAFCSTLSHGTRLTVSKHLIAVQSI
jgi:hypothetical protein